MTVRGSLYLDLHGDGGRDCPDPNPMTPCDCGHRVPWDDVFFVGREMICRGCIEERGEECPDCRLKSRCFQQESRLCEMAAPNTKEVKHRKADFGEESALSRRAGVATDDGLDEGSVERNAGPCQALEGKDNGKT